MDNPYLLGQASSNKGSLAKEKKREIDSDSSSSSEEEEGVDHMGELQKRVEEELQNRNRATKRGIKYKKNKKGKKG